MVGTIVSNLNIGSSWSQYLKASQGKRRDGTNARGTHIYPDDDDDDNDDEDAVDAANVHDFMVSGANASFDESNVGGGGGGGRNRDISKRHGAEESTTYGTIFLLITFGERPNFSTDLFSRKETPRLSESCVYILKFFFSTGQECKRFCGSARREDIREQSIHVWSKRWEICFSYLYVAWIVPINIYLRT